MYIHSTSLVAFLLATLSGTSLVVLVSGEASCSKACLAIGNCNAQTGSCECPWGVTGKECEVRMFPACQQDPTSSPQPGKFYPKNCLCFEQLLEHFNCGPKASSPCELTLYQLGLADMTCYTYHGVHDSSQQFSVMPALNSTEVTWKRWSYSKGMFKTDPSERNVARNIWGSKCIAHPLSSCPGNCSGSQGMCIQDTDRKGSPYCTCYKGFAGFDCSERGDGSLCLNGCNNRGMCKSGFCHCIPPWYGYDCSRNGVEYDTSDPGTIPTFTQLKMYTYELPHWLASPIALDDNIHDEHEAHQAYRAFHEQALNDNVTSTRNPWEANLFYIPAQTYSYASNTGNGGPHTRRVIQYVRETWPFFNRSGGKDHLLWYVGDKGACHLDKMALPLIKVTHWGYHVNTASHDPSRGPIQFTSSNEQQYEGCFNPLRDVHAPPWAVRDPSPAHAVHERVVSNSGHAPQRDILFFFAGGVRTHQPAYSGGVRQAIQALYTKLQNETLLSFQGQGQGQGRTQQNNSDIIFMEGHTKQYEALLKRSKFCIAPYGDGFGLRVTLSMLRGCIPVIIQDFVLQPLEDVLPYHEFSIRLPKRSIPQLHLILRNISEAEMARLRLGMARHYPAFMWSAKHGGTAYQWTMQSLYRKMLAYWANLYKRRSV